MIGSTVASRKRGPAPRFADPAQRFDAPALRSHPDKCVGSLLRPSTRYLRRFINFPSLQEALDEPYPVRSAHGEIVIVEIVAGRMQLGGLVPSSVADAHETARTLLEHVGEVFAAGDLLGMAHDVVEANEFLRDLPRELRLAFGVDEYRMPQPVIDFRGRAIACRLGLGKLGDPLLQ